MDSLYYQVWAVHFLCPLEDVPSPQMDETMHPGNPPPHFWAILFVSLRADYSSSQAKTNTANILRTVRTI